ncbi:hypothetical protein [Runella limosa]|uniref:hypothetical protein n=1 Tax=Runella limosa TaxID=370978 RepID=UPI0003F911A0|nr:hypothetical protein [Runella limosa]
MRNLTRWLEVTNGTAHMLLDTHIQKKKVSQNLHKKNLHEVLKNLARWLRVTNGTAHVLLDTHIQKQGFSKPS